MRVDLSISLLALILPSCGAATTGTTGSTSQVARTTTTSTATEPVWYFQVASIVCGHLLTHDWALADFGAGAVRSQYAMLVLMAALTTLGLLILAG